VRRARRATLALLCAVLPTLGCHRAARGDDELRAAREAAALAWVNALGAGDAATLRRLTADPFVVRGVGADRRCEGRIAGETAFDEWLGCARAKEDLRRMSETWALLRRAPPRSPERAAFEQYLPHVVDGDEAWSRFVGVEESARAREALDAISKEAGSDGDWVMIAASWLHTSVALRLQVVGAVATPHVHAVLVDITRTE
jgi:hypothetical protein